VVKRGGWLKRYTRLRAGGKRLQTRAWLARRTRLRAKGGHLFEGDRDPAYLAWIDTLPCTLRGLSPCLFAVTHHHTVKQSHAGADHSAVPMCGGHHTEVETTPKSVWRRRYPGVDLKATAQRLWMEHIDVQPTQLDSEFFISNKLLRASPSGKAVA
jgi:hypothetical protein